MGRLLVLLTIALSVPAFAQHRPAVARVVVPDEFSFMTVNQFVQDRLGFLWLACEDGLRRYDGFGYTTFTHNRLDSTSLSGNYLWALCLDDSLLWAGTEGAGLNCFDPVTESFVRFAHDPGDTTSLSHDGISSLLRDRSGRLWAGTWGGGLNLFDRATRTFRRYRHIPGDPRSLAADMIWTLAEDAAGRLWVGTQGEGACRMDPARGTFEPMGHLTAWRGTDNTVTSIVCDPRGIVWLATYGGGIVRYNPADGSSRRFLHDPSDPGSLSDDTIIKLQLDSRGTLWVGTLAAGLCAFDTATGRSVRYASVKSDIATISTNDVRALFEDRSRNLWVGVMDGPPCKLDLKPPKFFRLTNNPSSANSLSGDYVYCIMEDRSGVIWVGTYGAGLTSYDPATGRFARYRHDPSRADGLSSNLVRTVLEGRDGQLWVGTLLGSLARLDRRTGRFTHFRSIPGDSCSLSNNNVRSLWEDSRGDLWVGNSGGGLHVLDRSNGCFRRAAGVPGLPGSPGSSSVLDFCEEPDGTIWIATFEEGLHRLDPGKRTLTTYRHIPGDPVSPVSNVFSDVHCGADGTVWAANWGNGLLRYDRTQDRFAVLSRENGFASDNPQSILEDHHGVLWIGSDRGLTRYDPASGAVQNYDLTDGLQPGGFVPGAVARLRSGWLYFGGTNGISYFHPDSVRDNPYTPDVVFTGFQVFNKPAALGRSPVFVDRIELPHTDHSFSFEFAALEFTQPEKNRFQYMLEGFDREWVFAGRGRTATYTHLDPGTYAFRVRGSNNNGKWGPRPAALLIEIVPAFWDRWWFRAGIGLLLLGSGGLVLYRRLARARQERAAREEFARQLIASQEEERKRIAGELHDSIGQNLVFIRNRALLGIGRAGADPGSLEQLNEISTVALEALDDVRQIAHNLRPYQLDRLGLTRAIRSLVERAGTASETRFTADVDEVDGLLPAGGDINIYRIVQELITNLLKHAGATEASVTVRREGSHLAIVVRDDGRGFASRPTELRGDGGGMGMRGIAERARLMGGSMVVESVPGAGTAVTVTVPVGGSPA